MWRAHSKLFVLSLAILYFVNNSVRSYVITTPRKWSLEESNRVCVVVKSPFGPEDNLKVGIKVKDSFVTPLRALPLVAGELSTCSEVSVGETTRSEGNLVIEGKLEGVDLAYDKVISFSRIFKTFIQTDKYIYKPKQKVQFRILSIKGPYVKVSTDQYEEIYVENPSGVRIAQWLNVSNSNGLIHHSFQLSDEPEQGEYKIYVRSVGQSPSSSNFKVEEYVLPKFEVKINPPTYILGTQTSFTVEVCAKYTFGQPVHGMLSLKVTNRAWGSYLKEKKINIPIVGCVKSLIETDELNINSDSYYASSTKFYASVVEDGTGVKIKAKHVSVDITRRAIKFEDISVQKFSKPELPYTVQVKVSFPDGSPAAGEPMNVTQLGKSKTYTTNDFGVLKVVLPPNKDSRLTVTSINYPAVRNSNTFRNVMYKSQFHKSFTKYRTPSNSSLIIFLEDDELPCSSSSNDISFEVPIFYSSKNQSAADISIQVVSRGQIQFSKTFKKSLKSTPLFISEALLLDELSEPEDKDVVRGSFIAPISLPKTTSPKAEIILWYTRDDGEVVADGRSVDIAKCLSNEVRLSWADQKAQPGDPATLSLKAHPLSLCSLGVVDKSVKLLSDKNKPLTLSSIFDQVAEAEVHGNSLIDDFEYCRKRKTTDKPKPPVLPPVILPIVDDPPRNPPLVLDPEVPEVMTPEEFEPQPLLIDDVVDLPEPADQNEPEEGLILSRKKRDSWYPYEYFSREVDAIKMFDDAGLYLLSNHETEFRTCEQRYRVVMLMSESFNTAVTTSAVFESPTRVYFPETWLWDIVSIGEDGVIEDNLSLPDTVTEWVGNAVCVHHSKGVGISNTASITTFRDFFADLTLPSSVKRGETFPVKISVFNYLKESLPIRVVLEESPDYEIVPDGKQLSALAERSSCISPEDKVVHSIRIKPTAVGDINITVSAVVDINSIESCGQGTGKIRKDVLTKPIKVDIEGFLKEETKSNYICSKDPEDAEVPEAWVLSPPTEVVPDSARGFVSVYGDLMGPTIENLGHLVRMPYGCGEQNMLNFAPNIYVMKYLESSQQSDQQTIENAIQFMEKGYQRELNYRHHDGSFSAFGNNDASGSTWLTAFVLKCFAQARKFINIDENDLGVSSKWLRGKQLENGCFQSVGKVLHKGMKGGLSGGDDITLLSSFVLISLIESGEEPSSSVVRDALFCLNAANDTNPYSLAVRSYALALAESPDAKINLEKLMELKEESQFTLHWPLPNKKSSNGMAVETAAYALLTLLKLNDKFPEGDYAVLARKVVKWINNQRNGQGGFVSTQDTILALQSLAEFESKFSPKALDASVLVHANEKQVDFRVNEHNKLLLQKTSIPSFPATVSYDIAGEGCLLIQAVMRYNVPYPEPSEAFSLRIETNPLPGKSCKKKKITACASYLLEDKESNMAILEVNLVSGYIPVKKDLKSLVSSGVFKRYEVDGSLLTFYVDEFGPEETCATFTVLREVDVEDPKPGSVKIYDYYKPEYFVTQKFDLPLNECWKGENAATEIPEIVSVETNSTNRPIPEVLKDHPSIQKMLGFRN